jgi:hypothetical protein
MIIKKKKLQKRGALLKFIDQQINSTEYEVLGCFICRLCGSNYNYVTKRSGDHGIDFVSIIPAHCKYHLFPNLNKQIKIIGQSKKWNYPVKRGHIELLNSSIDRIKQRSIYVIEKFPDWVFNEIASIIGVVIGHNGFQSGAIDYANDLGITLADSRDLAEIISLKFPLEISVDNIILDVNKNIQTLLGRI